MAAGARVGIGGHAEMEGFISAGANLTRLAETSLDVIEATRSIRLR